MELSFPIVEQFIIESLKQESTVLSRLPEFCDNAARWMQEGKSKEEILKMVLEMSENRCQT